MLPFPGGFGEQAPTSQVSDVVNSCPDLLFPIIPEGSCSATGCGWSHSSVAGRYKAGPPAPLGRVLSNAPPLPFEEGNPAPEPGTVFPSKERPSQ